ncbi:MAG: hypothetical protein HQK51_21200 [Oligoflexia bacterium]|nr:hypothetical protein [Oligoflexia bacterium]
MYNTFDIKKYSIEKKENHQNNVLTINANKIVTNKKVATKKFLKGPVPLELLQKASKCPGKGLHVMIILLFLDGFDRGRELKLTKNLLSDFGISRSAADRAVTNLEKTGLILVERHKGRKKRITVNSMSL